MHDISWPALEGLTAYAFLIALSWSLPATTTFGPVLWGAFLIVGLGGGSITLAYLRERTEESQQPRLHGAGTALVALGTAIVIGTALL